MTSDAFQRALAGRRAWQQTYSGTLADETIFGISRKDFPKWGGWEIVDVARRLPGFPEMVNSSENLRYVAADFYRREFWDVIHGDELPQNIATFMLDTALDIGVGPAIRILQSVLGMSVDSTVSPATVKRAHAAGETILPWLFFAREDFHVDKHRGEAQAGTRTWLQDLCHLRREILGDGPALI